MATTPLLFVENVFDTVSLFPNAILTASSELAGREAFRVADYRRERTWWQPIDDGGGLAGWIKSNLGAGNSLAPDYLWIDRGHNLWGRTLTLSRGTVDGVWTTTRNLTVPALGTVGGDPTTATMCVTEEGALYSLFTAAAATRYHVLFVDYVAAFVPVIPGAMLGRRNQLVGYSRVFDEDASERTEFTDTSRAGYRGTDRVYSWRRALLDLGMIDSTDYDATIRTLRYQIFTKNQPWFLVMQWDVRPERGWLFQYDGVSWSFPMGGVLRDGQIMGREVGHSLA